MSKKYLVGVFAACCVLFASCGSSTKNGEIKVTNQEVEKAQIAGREAARVFVSQKWEDTLSLQQQLVEAGSKAAVYDSVPRLRAAFDSAFISTVETVRPDIAEQLKNFQKRMAQ